MTSLTLARHAMATRFEFILHGTNEASIRAAGEEAMEEITRLEAELGFYQSGSEIYRLNQQAAEQPVRVSPMLFSLLQRCGELNQETDGAFDITVAPLLKCWGLAGGTGRFPDPQEIATAQDKIGFDLLEFDSEESTVRFKKPGVLLDLGSIGKGFALDLAAEVLIECGIESALLHGGTSTSYAIGHPPEAEVWRVAIVKPESGVTLDTAHSTPEQEEILATVELRDSSLSVSAVWGKSFQHDGKTYGHVIDPRTGHPVQGALLSAVVTDRATDTDALATALLTLGSIGHEVICKSQPDLKSLVAIPTESDNYTVISNGI